MIFGSVLEPILNPLLVFHPAIVILIISFTTTLIITVIYKYATNQVLMKELKNEMTKNRQKMKQHRQDPEKMMKIQKAAMAKQFEYMKHSLRATLFTFLPVILIFGWLNTHLAYFPIEPGEPFSVSATLRNAIADQNITLQVAPSNDIELLSQPTMTTDENGKATWELQGQSGRFLLKYTHQSETIEQALLISDNYLYETPIIRPRNSAFKEIRINNDSMVLFTILGLNIGWLVGYIMFSIFFSITLRKLLRVY